MSKFLECLCDRISVSVTGQLGSLSNYDDEDDKDNVKKPLVLYYEQNNYCALASRFLVHFFDVHCTTTT